jgi:voltage-gated potassium channel Kch
VSVYGLLDTVFSASVFVDIDDPETFDFTYFSFVTLTTVGYGDVVAAQDLTRMVAVSEALIGQLYLVSIVALVVGNIGHRRRTGGGDPDGPEGGGADGDRAERPG